MLHGRRETLCPSGESKNFRSAQDFYSAFGGGFLEFCSPLIYDVNRPYNHAQEYGVLPSDATPIQVHANEEDTEKHVKQGLGDTCCSQCNSSETEGGRRDRND